MKGSIHLSLKELSEIVGNHFNCKCDWFFRCCGTKKEKNPDGEATTVDTASERDINFEFYIREKETPHQK